MRQIDQCSLEKGTTRSAVLRDAVQGYLDRQLGSPDAKRSAMLCEYTQVAVDVLIREQAPERREEIMATVQDRMERYHA